MNEKRRWADLEKPQPTIAECEDCCKHANVSWSFWDKADRMLGGVCLKEISLSGRDVFFCDKKGVPLRPIQPNA